MQKRFVFLFPNKTKFPTKYNFLWKLEVWKKKVKPVLKWLCEFSRNEFPLVIPIFPDLCGMRNGYLASSIHCKGHTMAGFDDFLSEIVLVCYLIFLAKHGCVSSKYVPALFFSLFLQLIYNFNLVSGLLLPLFKLIC